jgi:hypothetical protein
MWPLTTLQTSTLKRRMFGIEANNNGGAPHHSNTNREPLQNSSGSCTSSIPDTPHGNCHLLLAFVLTMKSLPALAKVVEDCAAGSVSDAVQ